MKKVLIILLVALLPLFAFAAPSYSYIDNYDIEVVVSRDNTYNITENIRYYFAEPTHGFYRSLIVRGEDGRRIRVEDFESSAPIYKVQKSTDTINYLIGDPNKELIGFNDYSFSYDYCVGKDNYDNFDAFYFNLLGTEWNDVIKKINFRVVFDDETVLDKNNIQIFRGRYRSTQSNGCNVYNNENVIYGNAKNLTPHEAITIIVGLEDGYFTLSKRDISAIKTSKLFLTLIPIFFIILIIVALQLYLKHGRNRILTSVVSPYPSGGLTPFDVRYLYKKTTDTRAISGEIMYLAENGYISIEYRKKSDLFSKDTLILHRLKNADSRLTREEKILYKALFSNGDSLNVNDESENIQGSLLTIKSLLKSLYNSGNKSIYTKESKKASTTVGVLAFVGVVLSIAVFIFVFKTLGVMFISDVKPFLSVSLISLFAFIPIISLLGSKCKKRSEYYSSALENILGVKDFIETVEKEKLEMLSHDGPSVFYKTLSFAIPLECENEWTRKFKGLTVPKNESFYGDFDVFDMVIFMHMTRALNNSILLNKALTPQSTHLGGGGLSGGFPGGIGGGFSGGGFGGGGGGRW